MDSPDITQESPRKRQKLSPTIEASASVRVPSSNADAHQMQVEQPSLQAPPLNNLPISGENLSVEEPGKLSETEVGITEYVTARTLRFSGILKKR